MKQGGGKAKGGGFEREVCKALSRWLSRGMRDDLFWRSAMSGGRASVQFKRGKKNLTQVGDISAIDPQGDRLTSMAIVECKFIKNLHFASMLTPYIDGRSAKDTVAGYWFVLRTIAAKERRVPVLVAKQNGVIPFVLLDQEGEERFRMPMRAARFPFNGAVLYPLDEFLMVAKRP